jgi:hypothetical protein
MKRKFKLFATLASLCLSVALMAFGVYAATNVTYNVTSTVSFAAQVAGTWYSEVRIGTVTKSGNEETITYGDAVDTHTWALNGDEVHDSNGYGPSETWYVDGDSSTNANSNYEVEFHPELGQYLIKYLITFTNESNRDAWVTLINTDSNFAIFDITSESNQLDVTVKQGVAAKGSGDSDAYVTATKNATSINPVAESGDPAVRTPLQAQKVGASQAYALEIVVRLVTFKTELTSAINKLNIKFVATSVNPSQGN